MKITEMITRLQNIKALHGDLTVLNGNGYAIEEVLSADVEDHFGLSAIDWGFESGDQVVVIAGFDE